MTTEQCAACNAPSEGMSVKTEDNLALCEKHWNWWLARYLGNPAPCSAHVIARFSD